MVLLVERDPDPGVADLEADKGRAGVERDWLRQHLDPAFFGKLDGIADQVGQDLPQPPGVADKPFRQVRR